MSTLADTVDIRALLSAAQDEQMDNIKKAWTNSRTTDVKDLQAYQNTAFLELTRGLDSFFKDASSEEETAMTEEKTANDGQDTSMISPELTELLKIAKHEVKTAFVDPMMAGAGGAGGAMPPMGDPAAAGAAPMAGPMDPMAAMPPMGADPAAGPPMLTEDRVRQIVQESAGTGGTGEGAGPAKKKVDVNTEIYQIKKLLVFLLEELGVSVPPNLLLGDPAEDPQAVAGQAAADPASAEPGTPPESAIAGIEPMQGASPELAAAAAAPPEAKAAEMRSPGRGVDVPQGLREVEGKAAALARLIRRSNEGQGT